jgi:hypothetical protein
MSLRADGRGKSNIVGEMRIGLPASGIRMGKVYTLLKQLTAILLHQISEEFWLLLLHRYDSSNDRKRRRVPWPREFRQRVEPLHIQDA